MDRKTQITKMITGKKFVSVEELSQKFGVSGETIRRDLKALEVKGVLKRTYGGAFLEGSRENDVSIQVRKSTLVKGKEDIAKLCLQFIQPDDTIFLDSSTTSLEIAKIITNLPVTIVTNSLLIVDYLSRHKDIRIILLGGVLDVVNMCFTGKTTLSELSNYFATKGFISCRSLSGKYGAMDSNEQIGLVRTEAMKNCYQSFLIADHTKFNQTALYQIGNIEEFDAVITDEKPGEHWIQDLAEKNIPLLYPNSDETKQEES
ncbi:MAG: DeoR/GlpR family DNA-binding transcription regulator [Oscillospiraceae bacterium]